jgi:hypothetical protein
MAMQKKLKCSKCDRRFALPAHLARHMNTAHGSGKKRKAPKARKGRKPGRRPGRPAGRKSVGLDLSALSLSDLCQVIEIARAEAAQRLEQM